MPPATTTTPPPLAIDGGLKGFDRQVVGQPKIGVAEFLALAQRFGFKPDALARLREAVSDADLIAGGPNLAGYACPHPAPAANETYAQLAAQTFGTRFAVGVSSGTGALHSAMIAVGAAPGKEVVVPATGFIATAFAVALTGATPVFCDVDESLQLDPRKLEPLISRRTVAVAPTHHWGVVADMDPIMAIARRHNLRVVEDCAQSPGASYRGRPVGSIGDVGCFSISAYKIIGGGEGGLIVTSDQRLFDRARQAMEAGGLWRGSERFSPPRYPGELFVGTNYRLSELEATVDIVQLGKLPGVVGRFRKAYRRVVSRLGTYRQITPQKHHDPAGDIGYLLRFFPSDHDLAGKIAAALRAEGVGGSYRGQANKPDWHLYSHMYPLMQREAVARQAGACPVADDLYNRCIGIGISQWFTDDDADAFGEAINKVLAHYCDPDPAAPRWM